VTKELQYPWRFGADALRNYVFFANLHTRLFPYIYSCAKEASTSGLPIIRPLVLLHQADENTFGIRHAYLFGDAFLVAPMMAPNATGRAVYLPAGRWLDFWTNAVHQGGQTVTWANPDQTRMPLFVREGAIVPMLPTDVQSLCDAAYVNNPLVSTPDGGLLVQVYPGGVSHFSVYDGTAIDAQGNSASGTVTLSSPARSVQVRILANEPAAITRDGTLLPRLTAPADFAVADSGWQFDATTGFIMVKFLHAGGTTEIQY
jgi:alpha-glucosidase (family GH31 glycosyl hydrolase)